MSSSSSRFRRRSGGGGKRYRDGADDSGDVNDYYYPQLLGGDDEVTNKKQTKQQQKLDRRWQQQYSFSEEDDQQEDVSAEEGEEPFYSVGESGKPVLRLKKLEDLPAQQAGGGGGGGGIGAPDRDFLLRDGKAKLDALAHQYEKFDMKSSNQKMSVFERQRISRWTYAPPSSSGTTQTKRSSSVGASPKQQRSMNKRDSSNSNSPQKLSQEEWGYAYGPVPDWFTLPPVDDELIAQYGPDAQWTLNGGPEVVRKRLWRRRSQKYRHELKFNHPGPQWQMRHRENSKKGLLNHFVYGGETQKFRPYFHKYTARYRKEHGYPGDPIKYGYAIKPAPRYVARAEGTWAPNPHWTLPPDRESREYYAMLDAEHIRHEPREGPHGRKFAPYDPRLTYEERQRKDQREGIWRSPLVSIRANHTWAPAAVLRNISGGPLREYDHPFWHYHPWAMERQRNAELVTRADLRALGYKGDPQFDPASERNHFYVPFNDSRYSYKNFRRRAVERKRIQAEVEGSSLWGRMKRFWRHSVMRQGRGSDTAILQNMIGPPAYSEYAATRLATQKADDYYGALDPTNRTAVEAYVKKHGGTVNHHEHNGTTTATTPSYHIPNNNIVIGRKYPFKRNFMSDDVLQWKRDGVDDDHFDIEDDEDDPDLDDNYRDNYLGVPHLDRARKKLKRPKGWDPLVHWSSAVTSSADDSPEGYVSSVYRVPPIAAHGHHRDSGFTLSAKTGAIGLHNNIHDVPRSTGTAPLITAVALTGMSVVTMFVFVSVSRRGNGGRTSRNKERTQQQHQHPNRRKK